MTSYQDYLAARGYVRRRVEWTQKASGDLVLGNASKPVERVGGIARA